VLALAPSAFPQVTVIFTRHAEKADAPANDPILTEAGRKRAALLASMLADSGVEAIYVTEVQRTQLTAGPLAERVHIKPTVLPAKDTASLVKAIRERKSGVVVVVGHSNTVPDIIAALGGPKFEIQDSQYDNLFVLMVEPSKSSLLRLHYGDTRPVQSQDKMMK
jgi:broad specificity phosphatase PhoE